MTLLGLILVIVFSGLVLANRSWNAGSKRAGKINDMRLIVNLIRRTIAEIQPIMWGQDAGNPVLSFSGRSDVLVFTGPLPAQAGAGGIYLMSLELKDTAEGKQLLLRRQPYDRDLQAPDERAEVTVLVEGVTRASFSYFGSENIDDAPRWVNEWQSPMRLPQLVRLSLSTDSVWPDIVANVHNDQYGTWTALPGARPRPAPDEIFFLR